MNIFVLDIQPGKAARYHCDKHVVKMTLEYAQILATALQMRGFAHTEIYKPTHTTHPCVHWAAESYGNYNWLWDLFSMTASEYTFRFGKTHQSWFTQAPIISPIRNRFNHLWENEKNQHMTPWAQCMPDQYKAPSAVDAYRAYYCGEKARFARYTNRECPGWLKPSVIYTQERAAHGL
jgi:hypothetical protein